MAARRRPRTGPDRATRMRDTALPRPPAPDECRFDFGQRQILAHLCHLVPEQIAALEQVLPRVRSQLQRILPPRSVGRQQGSADSEALAPKAKHRAVCAMIATLDQALHAGFDAHHGNHSTHAYAPRVSASAKSAFLDMVNLCYDAVGFPGVSAAKAIDTYRRSLLRDGLRSECTSRVQPRPDERRVAVDGEKIRDRMPICGEHALPADTNSIL